MTAQCSPPPSEPGEESVLPVKRNGSDAAFHYIGIDFDAAVTEEAGEAIPQRDSA
jgi:hypothetical protein